MEDPFCLAKLALEVERFLLEPVLLGGSESIERHLVPDTSRCRKKP